MRRLRGGTAVAVLLASAVASPAQESSHADLVALFHDWRAFETPLLVFEQHLYLRQPGYGTSYVTGKYLLERTLADWAKLLEERGEEPRLWDFFDRLNAIDSIPISLARWELTGLADDVPGGPDGS